MPYRAVIRDPQDRIVATGLSFERADNAASMVNKTSHVENAETSAWGRALGNFGIGIDDSVASADEVRTALGLDEEAGELLIDDSTDDHGYTPQAPIRQARTSRPAPAKKPAPKTASPEQIEQIKALAGELGKDIETEVLAPLAKKMVVEQLTFDTLPELLAAKVIEGLQKRLNDRTDAKE